MQFRIQDSLAKEKKINKSSTFYLRALLFKKYNILYIGWLIKNFQDIFINIDFTETFKIKYK